MQSLPKLSYVLLSYNREQYIRGAIESAFSQDYEGELEYIFSDDCSTDNTFAIMQECVTAYQGKRKIILTQTPKNVNLAGHTNHAVALSSGDYIVRADDDDFSFPNRCTLLAEAINQNHQCLCFIEPTKIVTDLPYFQEFRHYPIESKRRYFCYNVDTLIKHNRIDPLWCTGVKSYARQLYSEWPPLPLESANVDDLSLALRALMTSSICRITGSPAILYRRGADNMCGSSEGDGSIRALEIKEEKLVAFFTASVKGINATYKQLIDSEHKNNQLIAMTQRLIKRHQDGRDWWDKSIYQRLVLSKATLRNASMKVRIYTIFRALPKHISVRLCSYFKAIRAKI